MLTISSRIFDRFAAIAAAEFKPNRPLSGAFPDALTAKGEQLYAVVDPARTAGLPDLIRAAPRAKCLFTGELDADFTRAAPFLVTLEPDTALFDAWREEGLGAGWGVLCHSAMPFENLLAHFRRFLHVKLPNQNVAMFRFFDPRVFALYLPACEVLELFDWFYDVEVYHLEDVAAGRLRSWRFDGAKLRAATPNLD